jgi:DNA-binding NarL/FixJ family response regulator
MGVFAMLEKKRVVIAEDHKILREGLRSLLSISEKLEVVGEAGDGMSAIRTIKETDPDLVLLDLNMPKMDGIAVIKEIKQQSPETKILALTMHRKEDYILEVFNSGGDGYCLKSGGHEDLMMAIQAVLDGKRYISPEISGLVLEGFLESRKTIKKKSSFEILTQREKEVLKLVGEGYQNKEIADYLCISAKTVEKHRANIMQKLDLHTASALTAYAIEKGLVVKE